MNKNIFCSRKGGATIQGKFCPAPRVTAILARQLERATNKLVHREKKRAVKQVV